MSEILYPTKFVIEPKKVKKLLFCNFLTFFTLYFIVLL